MAFLAFEIYDQSQAQKNQNRLGRKQNQRDKTKYKIHIRGSEGKKNAKVRDCSKASWE